jgi:predicted transposase YdaD
MAKDHQKQSYDNLLKRLVENQPAAILPWLFPDLGIEIVEELNVEVLLPPRRTDRVYRARLRKYGGKMVILHVEFESTANTKMAKRLLIYHALLLEKHNLPVLSLIVYPFEGEGGAFPSPSGRG